MSHTRLKDLVVLQLSTTNANKACALLGPAPFRDTLRVNSTCSVVTQDDILPYSTEPSRAVSTVHHFLEQEKTQTALPCD